MVEQCVMLNGVLLAPCTFQANHCPLRRWRNYDPLTSAYLAYEGNKAARFRTKNAERIYIRKSNLHD